MWKAAVFFVLLYSFQVNSTYLPTRFEFYGHILCHQTSGYKYEVILIEQDYATKDDRLNSIKGRSNITSLEYELVGEDYEDPGDVFELSMLVYHNCSIIGSGTTMRYIKNLGTFPKDTKKHRKRINIHLTDEGESVQYNIY